VTEGRGRAAELVSYDRLYRQWEQNPWSATDIDLSVDEKDWKNRLTGRQRDSIVWNYSMFLVGEDAGTRALTTALDSEAAFAERIFLSTQIVDEARHHVFFDRFMREVAGYGYDTASTLQAVEGRLCWGFRQVVEELDRVVEALRKKPKDRALLAQTIALYHVMMEGSLAVPERQFVPRYIGKYDLLPGFSEGLRNVSRDEARHVAFGVKLLSDLIRSSKECRQATIEAVDRALRWSVGFLVPPNADYSYVECFDCSPNDIFASAMRSLDTHLKMMGIARTEIPLLAHEDAALSYEERARRAIVLVESKVVGDDSQEPELSREAFEILFEDMARSIDIEIARSIGGPIEWDFSDAESWHLVVTDGHVEAKLGGSGNPALRLECASPEFAKIAVGRTDPRWALLKRKLRVHGPLSTRTKLPKLFG
jgi:Ribonucleotide reductase, small chain/SCP-2 sterol transfer family